MKIKSGNTSNLWDICKDFLRRPEAGVCAVVFAAAVSPRFFFGMLNGGRSLHIRIEDLLLFAFGVNWFLKIVRGKEKFILPANPLYFPVGIWALAMLASTAINLYAGRLFPDRAFFYCLKQLEYFFFFFFVWAHVRDTRAKLTVIGCWAVAVLVNAEWIALQFVMRAPLGENRVGVQYLSAVGESALFPLSGFFLLIYLGLFSVLLFGVPKKPAFRHLLEFAVPAAGLSSLLMMRRISIAALVLCTIVLIAPSVFRLSRVRFNRRLLVWVCIAAAAAVMLTGVLAVSRYAFRPDLLSHRRVQWELDERFTVWQWKFEEAFSQGPLSVAVGRGVSALLTISTEESHNQFVRNFVETGIIGMSAFLYLVVSILSVTRRTPSDLDSALRWGSFVSTLALLMISLTADAFTVVKINFVFWSFLGLALAPPAILKRKDETSNR
jgi:putative inorganic carbon (hco3(-)) transporter